MENSKKPSPQLCDTVSHNVIEDRRSTAKDGRAARSLASLRQALLGLLEERAFESITVRDICAAAGVHYATFFRHHASKEELLEQLAAEQIATLVDLTLPIKDATDDRTAFRALCAYVDEHRSLWSVLLNGGAGPAMRAEWLRRARMVAATRRPVSTWLPMDLGTICSTSLIAETISWWLGQPRSAYSVDDVAAILHRLVGMSTLAPD